MHFFIDHTVLTTQASSNDGFGPSLVDPTNKYDVSANFKLTSDAKAFACQAGHIIVTDFFDVDASALDPDLVNIILKPTAGLDVTFPAVKYYLYRGIKRDSFFSGGGFNAEDPSNTDTVRKMWLDWHANVASSPDPLAPSDLGFDATQPGTILIEEMFGGKQVTLAGVQLRPRQVSEGEWIGTFGFNKKICFEVIVEAELLNLNLEYARKSKVQIDISALAAPANPTPAQQHALRCEKEKILAFVDPAALFGMHFSVGVKGTGSATAKKGQDLATLFLSNFSSANRVYLDIRSDKGYSYNFYGNYGGGGANPKLIRIKPGSAPVADEEYTNQGWPLFSQSGWTGPGAKVNLELRLRIDDNTKPLLFVEDTSHLPAGSKNFLDQTKLRDGAAVDWSKPVNLKLDGSSPAGAKICVATHVRLQHLKQKDAPVVNTRLLQFNHTLDTVFGGIDLPIAGAAGTFGESRNDKVGLAEGAAFLHVPNTGMYFDSDVALLYSSARVAHKSNPNKYPEVDYAISTLDNVVRSPVFPSDIVFSRWSVVEAGVTIKLIDLSLYKKGAKNTSIDGIFFLGLKRDELSRLQATAGFGPVHQRFLVFEETNEIDDNGFPFKKYEVKVQGLNADGDRILVAPDPVVQVFGSGANMFCSSEFANTVNLPDVPPDPGVMKQWEFVFDGTYEKGDASVDAVESTGKFTVSDIGNDFNIGSPRIRLRARYFFPTDTSGATTISTRKPSYPLVVVVHANGSRFTDYDLLGKHLAHNGFIVSVVNLLMSRSRATLKFLGGGGFNQWVEGSEPILLFNAGTSQIGRFNPVTSAITVLPMTIGVDFVIHGPPPSIEFLTGAQDFQNLAARGRAEVIFKHLQVLKHKFGAQVDNNIGLIGHSRGGEAVVRAPAVIGASVAPGDLNQIAAIASLAPTDRYEKENLTQDIPYFVLYGSRDGDVNGGREPRRKHLSAAAAALLPPRDQHAGSGGFSLYDRANNATIKSMGFVYGATHNGFMTASSRDPVHVATLPDNIQKATVRAYMNAFMRQHLLGEPIWRSYFTGEFIPGSLGTDKIFPQFKEMGATRFQSVDDFEDTAVNDWATSSSGEAVAHSRGGTGLAEGFLNPFAPSIDVDSPHDTFGLKVTGWTASDTLTFTVSTSANGADVNAFTHLSFRITQVARKVNSSIDSLKVVIEDTLTNRFPAPLGRTIPNPDPRPDNATLTKSAFMTVRIPLATYRDNSVDLSKVKLVQFEFPTAGAGNIEIDDVEFTN